MVNLVHIVAVNVPLFAVFAKEDGTPDFRPVMALGTMESVEDGRRVIAGFPVGEHLEGADFKPDHVGYTNVVEPEAWVERCKAKRETMRKADATAKLNKIIVPKAQVIPGEFRG